MIVTLRPTDPMARSLLLGSFPSPSTCAPPPQVRVGVDEQEESHIRHEEAKRMTYLLMNRTLITPNKISITKEKGRYRSIDFFG